MKEQQHSVVGNNKHNAVNDKQQSDSVYSHLNMPLEVLHPNNKVKTVRDGLMTFIRV